MNRIHVFAVRIFLLAALAVCSLGAWADWPQEGEIRYDVMRGENGFKLGEAVHRWEQDGAQYRMQTEVETTGLAGALYSFRYVQTSEGQIVAGALQPTLFRVEQSGRETEQAHFDWEAQEVLIERSRGRKETHEIEVGDHDVLSVWHLVATEGVEAVRDRSLVTNRRVSPTEMAVAERERLRLPVGEVSTVRVSAASTSGSLKIDLWLSEDHDWLPVRILMEDDKGKVLDQQAVRVTRGNP